MLPSIKIHKNTVLVAMFFSQKGFTMPKSTNNRKSAPPSEKTSTLTVNEFLKLFIVIMLAVVAIRMDNITLPILLFADLVFVAFVLAGPTTPSAFKEFLSVLKIFPPIGKP
jgi:hypothetical protein